jgi:hypothetical protein
VTDTPGPVEGITDHEYAAASNGDRLTDADGYEWLVLVAADGERSLVRPDVVEYGTADHPLLTGAAAFSATLGALIAPVLAVFWSSSTYALSTPVTIVAALGAVVASAALARGLLYYTPVGDQLMRFLDWQDNLGTIKASENL